MLLRRITAPLWKQGVRFYRHAFESTVPTHSHVNDGYSFNVSLLPGRTYDNCSNVVENLSLEDGLRLEIQPTSLKLDDSLSPVEFMICFWVKKNFHLFLFHQSGWAWGMMVVIEVFLFILAQRETGKEVQLLAVCPVGNFHNKKERKVWLWWQSATYLRFNTMVCGQWTHDLSGYKQLTVSLSKPILTSATPFMFHKSLPQAVCKFNSETQLQCQITIYLWCKHPFCLYSWFSLNDIKKADQ